MFSPKFSKLLQIGLMLTAVSAGPALGWSAGPVEDLPYYQALSLYHQKQWEPAKKAFQAYAQQYPQSKWHLAVQLRLADMADTPGDSIAGYLAVLNSAPRSEWAQDALWGLISTYFTLGQYAKVVTYEAQLNPHNPSRLSKALTLVGDAHLALKEPDQAKRAFTQAFETALEPLVKQKALVGMGDAEAALKTYDRALTHYNQYLKDYPKGPFSSHALNQKSHLLALQGDQAQAMKTAQRLVTDYPESEEASKAKRRLEPASERDNFTVQVGAFSKKAYAQSLEKKLRKQGYNAYHLKVTLKDQTLIQVRVGQYHTRAFAEEIGEKLKQQEELPFVVVPYQDPRAEP